MAIKLVISGCCGRMGIRIASLALEDSIFAVAGAIETKGHPSIGQDVGQLVGVKPTGTHVTDDVKGAIQAGDVLIEFTRPEPTVEHVRIAAQLKRPAVIGTTGLTDAQRAEIIQAAKTVPIVLSPNMSVGVTLLFELAQIASQRLGGAYDVEVVEAHHKAKLDSPSGTAKRLAEVVAEGRRQPTETIPVHAIRAGDVVGDHTVIFAGPSERLELTHRAQSRDVFALGALRAAQFVVTQRPGLYDMRDVLKK
ncbi:MAG TPA: 4-hydroxy-tetrahydrodipicolinate reductase [Candidatus Omnitrophica bacterium]|nr:MAG: 4-hydroxy-tetrahydrodipicolinate reductase [Omnitrophica WOR_2 bacterium GWA2_63_20]OGX32816.1 MAG: 4-hydroxy-tetrahydrodipicolinate reductase [Omnitrophica WOR_2 bacterium RIFCSPHIGHO2_12_FULL_64_13]OGX36590.1 MAG: 4-hydroxy-tetrahydrodipicolinate reductase [Omnitrophica WOR_2 bacterium RIFCSPHIGHO2_02_FULL_63_39]OGX46018.1 MAG: 4-hydroxy-tetrahydrodipicolinate reductase [Omnitrophica WOR_2 bacterium RIFCSPLOWO2_02_FULL_63_16]OGX47336.1 MAG: 4-hydroxy-tetrahydrodipicolinate reductase [